MVNHKNWKSRDKVRTAVIEFIGKNGYCPTLDEVGKAVGIKAKSHVKKLVDELKEAGMLTYEPGQARTLRPTIYSDGRCYKCGQQTDITLMPICKPCYQQFLF